jgi:amphi-Trp domain-containing protein
MANEKILLKSEKLKSLEEIADFLRQLADKVQTGQLTLKQGGEEVNLSLPDKCVLEVKVDEEMKGKAKKYELEVEIEWKEGQGSGELKIA